MEKLLKRKLEGTIARYAKRREIIGVRGPRQAGKTTLLKVIEGGIAGNKAFVNLDLMEYRAALEGNPVDFVKRFRKEGERLYLFLDEIQRVKDAGEKLKIIYDEFRDVKMFASGSSSLELKAKVLPPLVGRLLLFELYPLDFEEFLLARDEGLHRLFMEKHASLKGFLEGKGEVAEPSFTEGFLRHWKEYAVFGGYPEVVKSADEEERKTLLKNLFNLYLEKDIAGLFKLEDAYGFANFLKSIAFSVSGFFSLSSLASDTKLSYRKAAEFLSVLQHTYIIFLLRPFHRNLSTEIKKSPKAYFWDIGLRNSAIGDFLPFDNRADRGQLMENFVARELAANFPEYKINCWRTAGGAEVDFVLSRGHEAMPVEVKLSGEGIGKGFYSFLDAYKPKKAVIVTLDKFGVQDVGGTKLCHVPVFYF